MRRLFTLSAVTGALVSWPVVAAPLKTFKEASLGFEIGLPQGCRHEIGPGTIEAICTPDFDAGKATDLAAAGAWLFEVDYEVAPSDATPYSLDALRNEIPETVCGENDAGRVGLTDLKESQDGQRRIYEARVSCPALGFLGLPEREALTRVIVVGDKRFRLLARTPTIEAAQARETAQAFLASFKLTD